MCYSTNNVVKPKVEVTYDQMLPYGTNGYRADCNNIPVNTLSLLRSVKILRRKKLAAVHLTTGGTVRIFTQSKKKQEKPYFFNIYHYTYKIVHVRFEDDGTFRYVNSYGRC